MSRLGDKFRSKITGKSVGEIEEKRAKKMEARKEKKGQKIIGKIESGNISKKKGNKKLETLQRKTANRSARIRKEKYKKGDGTRTKVYKNPITGRTRTVTKSRDSETGQKKKRVTVVQRKGSNTSQEVVRKSKAKVGDVNKKKKKIKNITKFGYTTKEVNTKASKKGGIGGRKRKDDKRHYYRNDPTVKRRQTKIKHGRRKGETVNAIGKKFGYEDV
tara:strand:+ start:87 stop:737 length:651 start_codon:yes stop_codon:yes gene_type:complete